MSEYIFRYKSEYDGELSPDDATNAVDHYGTLHGKIVRCRDCKFADWDITAWWCTRNKHYPFEIGELKGYGERSHLDGFCAWGVRKDGDAR